MDKNQSNTLLLCIIGIIAIFIVIMLCNSNQGSVDSYSNKDGKSGESDACILLGADCEKLGGPRWKGKAAAAGCWAIYDRYC